MHILTPKSTVPAAPSPNKKLQELLEAFLEENTEAENLVKKLQMEI